MAKLLLGKEVNASINKEIKAKVEKLKAQDITPTLGIIRIGEREDRNLFLLRQPAECRRR